MGVYEELGVKKLINAFGPVTKVGGSLMSPEVIEVMNEAANAFVDMDELLKNAGKRIAEITGAEAGFVTSGAAAGLAIATAACMAGTDTNKAKQLPDTSGMKDEVVILRCHRIHYDQAVRVAGARFVEVGFADWTSASDIEAVITDNTAAILYVAKKEKALGSVALEQVIDMGRSRSISVVVDAADELPPVSNLHKFTDMGADLVVFSGGKDIRGPQGSGLILGREDLIKACAVNGSPNYGIGRPMKVDKEEIVGLVKALELYVAQDFEAELKTWERQSDYLVEKLSGLAHVTVSPQEPVVPGSPGSFYLPAAYVKLDEERLGMTRDEVVWKLREGDPGIVVGESTTGIVIRVHMLEEGQEREVATRLMGIFHGP